MKAFIKNNSKSLIVLAAAIALLAAGIALGQYSQVLGKAIRICLECIGIG